MAKVQFGLSEAHYATFTYDEETRVYTYSTPKMIMSATSLSLEASGGEATFYADNILGFKYVSNQGYTGTLSGATLSADFRKDVLNEIKDSKGMYVESSNNQTKKFALLFQVETNEKPLRNVLWNCAVARPSATHNTLGESIEVDQQELSLTASPRADFHVKGYVTEGEEAYADWFKKVVEPVFII